MPSLNLDRHKPTPRDERGGTGTRRTRDARFPDHETPPQQLVDEEVRRLLESAHREVIELITHHRDALESLSASLLANETLDEHDAYAGAGVPRSVASPGRASLEAVWSSDEQVAAAGLPADNGRSVLPTTLTRIGASWPTN